MRAKVVAIFCALALLNAPRVLAADFDGAAPGGPLWNQVLDSAALMPRPAVAGRKLAKTPAASASVPLTPAAKLTGATSLSFLLNGVKIALSFALDPGEKKGVLTMTPENGKPPTRVVGKGLFWPGAPFTLLGRACRIVVHHRLPLRDTFITISEDGKDKPSLMYLTMAQGKAELLKLAQTVELAGQRYAVVQGPLAGEQGGRFLLILHVLANGKIPVGGFLPSPKDAPCKAPLSCALSPDGNALILAR